jgi:hypothetical protein
MFILIICAVSVTATFFLDHGTTTTTPSYFNQQQLAKISKSSTSYSFVVYGDNRDSKGRFNKMLLDINKKNVIFSMANGDLVSTGSKTELYDFIKQTRISKIPTLTVIGNHELYPGKGSLHYKQIFGPTYYSFAMKNSYFIVLDDSNNIGLGNTQRLWLINELKKSQKYKYRFIFFHTPLYDPRKGKYVQGHSLTNLKNAQDMNNLFDKYNVTMIFSSHIHGYFTGKWHKTPYIITGGAGVNLAGTNPQNFFFNYVIVHVNGNKVSYQVVKYPI